MQDLGILMLQFAESGNSRFILVSCLVEMRCARESRDETAHETKITGKFPHFENCGNPIATLL